MAKPGAEDKVVEGARFYRESVSRQQWGRYHSPNQAFGSALTT